MVVLVDGPALAFTVLGGGLSAGGVSDLALACDKSIRISKKYFLLHDRKEDKHTHAGAVNVELLGSLRLVVQVESTVVKEEGGGLVLGVGAASVLALEAGKDAAKGGVEGSILNTAAGVDGDDAEGLVGGSVGGRESGGSSGGEDQVLELHLEGWF